MKRSAPLGDGKNDERMRKERSDVGFASLPKELIRNHIVMPHLASDFASLISFFFCSKRYFATSLSILTDIKDSNVDSSFLKRWMNALMRISLVFSFRYDHETSVARKESKLQWSTIEEENLFIETCIENGYDSLLNWWTDPFNPLNAIYDKNDTTDVVLLSSLLVYAKCTKNLPPPCSPALVFLLKAISMELKNPYYTKELHDGECFRSAYVRRIESEYVFTERTDISNWAFKRNAYLRKKGCGDKYIDCSLESKTSRSLDEKCDAAAIKRTVDAFCAHGSRYHDLNTFESHGNFLAAQESVRYIAAKKTLSLLSWKAEESTILEALGKTEWEKNDTIRCVERITKNPKIYAECWKLIRMFRNPPPSCYLDLGKYWGATYLDMLFRIGFGSDDTLKRKETLEYAVDFARYVPSIVRISRIEEIAFLILMKKVRHRRRAGLYRTFDDLSVVSDFSECLKTIEMVESLFENEKKKISEDLKSFLSFYGKEDVKEVASYLSNAIRAFYRDAEKFEDDVEAGNEVLILSLFRVVLDLDDPVLASQVVDEDSLKLYPVSANNLLASMDEAYKKGARNVLLYLVKRGKENLAREKENLTQSEDFSKEKYANLDGCAMVMRQKFAEYAMMMNDDAILEEAINEWANEDSESLKLACTSLTYFAASAGCKKALEFLRQGLGDVGIDMNGLAFQAAVNKKRWSAAKWIAKWALRMGKEKTAKHLWWWKNPDTGEMEGRTALLKTGKKRLISFFKSKTNLLEENPPFTMQFKSGLVGINVEECQRFIEQGRGKLVIAFKGNVGSSEKTPTPVNGPADSENEEDHRSSGERDLRLFDKEDRHSSDKEDQRSSDEKGQHSFSKEDRRSCSKKSRHLPDEKCRRPSDGRDQRLFNEKDRHSFDEENRRSDDKEDRRSSDEKDRHPPDKKDQQPSDEKAALLQQPSSSTDVSDELRDYIDQLERYNIIPSITEGSGSRIQGVIDNHYRLLTESHSRLSPGEQKEHGLPRRYVSCDTSEGEIYRYQRLF